jgi:hypothetical protein
MLPVTRSKKAQRRARPTKAYPSIGTRISTIKGPARGVVFGVTDLVEHAHGLMRVRHQTVQLASGSGKSAVAASASRRYTMKVRRNWITTSAR